MATKKNKAPEINPVNDDFGLMMNYAVRYAIGRRTYAPSAVIVDAKYSVGYGDDCDERDWMRFHEAVKSEKIKRGKELYVHWKEKECK